jgi:hypothetical protein
MNKQPVIGSYKTIIGSQQRGMPRKDKEANIEIKVGRGKFKEATKERC